MTTEELIAMCERDLGRPLTAAERRALDIDVPTPAERVDGRVAESRAYHEYMCLRCRHNPHRAPAGISEATLARVTLERNSSTEAT